MGHAIEDYQVRAIMEHVGELYSKARWHCDQVKDILGEIERHLDYLDGEK